MSLSAARLYRDRFSPELSLKQELADRGLSWVNGRLESADCCGWELSQTEVDELRAAGGDAECRDRILRGKSYGAIWLAERLLQGDYHWNRALRYYVELPEAVEELRLIRQINRAMKAEIQALGVNASATDFVRIGCKSVPEAWRFLQAFPKFANMKRVWNSSCQAPLGAINAMVNSPINYGKLPDWCLKTLVHIGYQFKSDRPGNIWRLIPASKAWKWCPELPKRVAEKVGKMSVKARMLAPIAWFYAERLDADGNCYDQKAAKTQAENVLSFWHMLDCLMRQSLGQTLINNIYENCDYPVICQIARPWGRYKMGCFLSEMLGVPVGLIDLPKEFSREDCYKQIAQYGSPEQVAHTIFGVTGKATIAAMQQCKNKDAWDWAASLAYGNPDLLQKYFKLEAPIAFQQETMPFLKAIGDGPALRMLQTLTYKVRGEVAEVDTNIVRDTGYLWQQIKNKPELGRVRCWLSVHEELARVFVAEQPNEALPVHPDWQPLDGLCAVARTWEIVLPKSTADLKLWGQLLSHCVGGYGPAVKSGRSVIFGVVMSGQLRYTVEMCPTSYGWTCSQFYGLRNSGPDRDLRDSVLDAITQSGLMG